MFPVIDWRGNDVMLQLQKESSCQTEDHLTNWDLRDCFCFLCLHKLLQMNVFVLLTKIKSNLCVKSWRFINVTYFTQLLVLQRPLLDKLQPADWMSEIKTTTPLYLDDLYTEEKMNKIWYYSSYYYYIGNSSHPPDFEKLHYSRCLMCLGC